MGNDIEIRVRVANQTQGGLAAVNTSLRSLRQNADQAAQGMRTLSTRSTAAAQSLRTIENRAQAATRALRTLGTAGDIRISAHFDGQAAQIQAAANAMRDLRGDAGRAATALGTLARRAAAAATALSLLEEQAEDATRALRRLHGQAEDTATAMSNFGTNVRSAANALRTFNTRMQTADGRFDDLSTRTRTLAGDMDDFGASVDGVNDGLADLRGGLGRLSLSAGGASEAFGGGGGGAGLRAQLIGLAAAVGTTLLPTIGALSPMLFGLTAVAGGGALALDDLKKKAKELKKPFEEWQKVAEKAVAPHTEKAVKSLKGAMADLNPVIETGAETFGRITEKAARFADSPAFKGALQKNVQMGSKFVEEFAGSVGRFTQAFLDFGTKSQPALDAWQNLLGGLLDTGLPGMFKELEQGIEGSSDFLDGLAYVINDSLLPSLGKIAGSFAEAFGPLLKEVLITAGDLIKGFAANFERLMTIVEPVARIMADAWHAVAEVFKIGAEAAGSLATTVGGALVESLLAVMGVDTSDLTGGFTKLSDWVDRNRGAIRDAFFDIAQGITDMVITGLTMLPQLYSGFQQVVDGILLGVDLLVSGLATTFGDLPVVGEQFKEWNRNFDEFAKDARGGLDSVGEGIGKLVDEAVPRLSRAKLQMNVDEAKGNLADIKAKLEDPALTKERKAKLSADKEAAERRLAEAKSALSAFDKKQATAKLDANSGPFWNIMGAVRRAGIPTKTGKVNANTGGFWSAVRGISGRVLGTSYINVVQRITKMANALNPFRAMGGPVRGYAGGGDVQHFPSGGLIQGPGGPRSDSILATFASGATARVSDTEYVVQSSAVKKYGLSFMDALNSGRLKVAALARGGPIRRAAGAAKDEIRDATSGSTEQSLLRLMDAISRGHIKMATALKQVNSALEKAKDKLSDLKSAAAQLFSSVKSGILSGANITKSAGGEGRVTINTLLSQMTADAANSKQFAGMLAQLKKKGLDKGLIEEIAQAGVQGGGLETAAAILGGGDAEIKRLTKLRHEIVNAGNSAGKTASDAFYGKAIQSQDKLVKALDRLADALKHKKKAAGGPASGLTVVGEEGPELLQLPFGSMVHSNGQSTRMAWESMLNAPRGRTGLPAAARGGGGRAQPIIVHQTITLDGRVVAQQIFDPLRAEIAHRGGSVQRSLGRGAS